MTLIHGDCLAVLRGLSANSIDSLVTDPPAGISFMGKEWDDDKGGRKQWIAWMTEVMTECLRVMKPGAHGLVWALPRTSHWTATALEDAGFEVRDVVTHLFGTGFPKSRDLSKDMDKAVGAKREVIGKKSFTSPNTSGDHNSGTGGWGSGIDKDRPRLQLDVTIPATEAAKQWEGWGTALKPASEHWILVRKPISEKTVAANVLKWGTGGLNIDGCRVGFQSDVDKASAKPQGIATSKQPKDGLAKAAGIDSERISFEVKQSSQGRFPANLILDEVAAQALDEQSGDSKSGKTGKGSKTSIGGNGVYSGASEQTQKIGHDDSGGASRFFYVAKASKSDKGTDNTHPTVKSTKLMEYLIKLVTPPNGTILDPFAGSGSTGVAAKKLGYSFLGIEQDQLYFDIAWKRIHG